MRGFVGGLLVVAALAVAVPPAQSAESGVNIALHQTVDGPSNAQRLKVGWARMFVGWSAGSPRAAPTTASTWTASPPRCAPSTPAG